MTANIPKMPKLLKCLLSHDQQTGLWLGHCLDFDLITSAPSEDEVWEALKTVVVAHVESCLSDNFTDGLTRTADQSAWFAFIDQFLTTSIRSELIEFKLKRNNQTTGVWMKGVEVETLPTRVPAFA